MYKRSCSSGVIVKVKLLYAVGVVVLLELLYPVGVVVSYSVVVVSSGVVVSCGAVVHVEFLYKWSCCTSGVAVLV